MVVSRDAERAREPVTIEALASGPLILYDAQYGAHDPMRRQLVDRAQRAGITLRPVIEVEGIEARAFVEIVERRLERVAEAALYAAGTSETD